MECEFCKKTFKTKSSINYHKKTTQYCLKIQGLSTEKGTFKCENCNKCFHIKNSFKKHLERCKENTPYVNSLRDKIVNLEKSISTLSTINITLEADKLNLQKRYDKLAMKAKIINKTKNNIVNLSIFSKSTEDIEKVVNEKYTKDYLRDGQTGVAQFAKRHLINTDNAEPLEYIVTDKSRFHGKFVGKNNESIPDINMQGLTEKIHPSIDKKACKIMKEENDVFSDQGLINGFTEVRKMIHDNLQFCKVFTKIHDVKNLPDGKKVQTIEFIIEDSDEES